MTVPRIFHGFGTRQELSIPLSIAKAQQVHGTGVVLVESSSSELPEADVLIAEDQGVAVGISTADCLPILMVDSVRGLVAAVHPRWRGPAKDKAATTLKKKIDMGGRPEDLTVCLGPSIGRCCYEVGKDVFEFFSKKDFFEKTPDSKWKLDLASALRDQLTSGGVPPEKIDHIDLCTNCRPELFYSYRREGAGCGKMVSFIQRIS